MENLVFSQKIYRKKKKKNYFTSLMQAFSADCDDKKNVLSALCVGEIRYFDDGKKEGIDYRSPLKKTVNAKTFRKVLASQDLQNKGCRGVVADNLMFVGRNEDCVLLDSPSLTMASQHLLKNSQEFNRITIHKAKFGLKGFDVKVENGIQLFMEPYYFWDFDEVKQHCCIEVVKELEKYHAAGYNLFGSSDGQEVVCLLGDCYILPRAVFEAWAGYRAPIECEEIQDSFLLLGSPNGGLLN